METLRINLWAIEFDYDVTKSAYSKILQSDPERCGCSYCKNFILARQKVYPKEFLNVLTRIGIDSHKEAEVAEFGEIKPGLHSYCGWFHFVGRILKRPKEDDYLSKSENFSWSFTPQRICLPDAFNKEMPIAQVDFLANVPWLLKEE